MDTVIKHRDINFCKLHPEHHQVHEALMILSDMGGVESCQQLSPYTLQVSYRIDIIDLASIESHLSNEGLHLDNSLLQKLKRALFQYTEETQRANLGDHEAGQNNKQIFVDHYQRRQRGCRDSRPHYWRNYR